MKDKVRKLIFSIMDILRENNEEHWASIFERYSSELGCD